MMIIKKVLLIVFVVVFLFSCKKGTESNSASSGLEFKDSLVAKTTSYNEDKLYFDYLPSSTTNQVVKHDYYTLSYNEKYEQAEWVAYELKKSYIKNNDFKRPYFIEDDKVTTGSADWRNYKQSGYDKGHLCPAGDMEFNKKAYEDTFLTSNISPQVHAFNDGIWNRLEQKVRYWAVKYDDIYVVTGGVLNGSNATIGKEKVLVPKYFYKVLLDESNGKYKMIAFLVPNEKSERPLYDFVVSVDSIEKLTGIDFFPHLDDKIEDPLEKNTDYKSWVF